MDISDFKIPKIKLECHGRPILFKQNQYSWTCPVCGYTDYKYKCNFCGDNGLLPFAVLKDNKLTEYNAVCNCDAIYKKDENGEINKNNIRWKELPFYFAYNCPKNTIPVIDWFNLFKFEGSDISFYNGNDYRYNYIKAVLEFRGFIKKDGNNE